MVSVGAATDEKGASVAQADPFDGAGSLHRCYGTVHSGRTGAWGNRPYGLGQLFDGESAFEPVHCLGDGPTRRGHSSVPKVRMIII